MTDLIKREDAIEAIQFGISHIKAFNNTTMIRFYERENEALEKAIKRVNELPSADQDRPIKTIQKPRECRNKNCVAMCSPAWAEFWFDKPDCPNYVRGDDRPIGHWIIDSYTRKCSVCEIEFCETDDVGDYIPDKFCPNCGAKME